MKEILNFTHFHDFIGQNWDFFMRLLKLDENFWEDVFDVFQEAFRFDLDLLAYVVCEFFCGFPILNEIMKKLETIGKFEWKFIFFWFLQQRMQEIKISHKLKPKKLIIKDFSLKKNYIFPGQRKNREESFIVFNLDFQAFINSFQRFDFFF